MLSVIPYLSLLLAVLLAYWPRALAGQVMSALPGGYDNHHPRDQQGRLEGRGRRALAAHMNGMEVLAVFGIAVLAAAQRHVTIQLQLVCCGVFLIARVVYVLAYLNDKATLRSGMFGLSMLPCFVLLGSAVFA